MYEKLISELYSKRIKNSEIIDNDDNSWVAKCFSSEDYEDLIYIEKSRRRDLIKYKNFIASCKLEGINICQKK